MTMSMFKLSCIKLLEEQAMCHAVGSQRRLFLEQPIFLDLNHSVELKYSSPYL